MTAFSREQEIIPFFTDPWTYPGLPVRPFTSCRLAFDERHHLVWTSWTIFDDGQHVYVRRIEWPCIAGKHSQTGEFTQTFAAECLVERHLADDLIAEAIAAAGSPPSTPVNAVAIDGAERHLRLWQAGQHTSLTWEKSVAASPLDAWFAHAAAKRFG